MSLGFPWQNLVESAFRQILICQQWHGRCKGDPVDEKVPLILASGAVSGHVSLGISCRRSIIEEEIETTRNINLLDALENL